MPQSNDKNFKLGHYLGAVVVPFGVKGSICWCLPFSWF